jgi:hypothetical protein
VSLIDFRIYRAALFPAIAAVVALLFSLQPIPDPLEAPASTFELDARRALVGAREVLRTPERPPGSEGDEAVADLVRERFAAVPSGSTVEQDFESSFEGDDVELSNVLLVLPGESEHTLLVLAARDSARGAGAASSAAQLGASEHTKTIVLASTSGGSDGATGARELVSALPGAGDLEAAVVLHQPGARDARPAFVLGDPAGDGSGPIQLVRTAERAVTERAGLAAESEGSFDDLARLAVPSGLGEAAALLEEGLDAVGISSAGERPLPPSDDGPDDLSLASLSRFGGAALSLVETLDAAPEPLEHGPASYIRFAGNLVPGWALALLALALILPAVVVAVDGVARAARAGDRPGGAIGWAMGRGVPLLAGLVVLYLVALLGLVPRPRFPFDPDRFGIGVLEVIALILLAGSVVWGFARIGPLRVPGGRQDAAALRPALGLVTSLSVLAVWIANPYLALLLTPAAHAWLLADRAQTRLSPLLVAAVALLSLAPAGAAFAHVAGALDLGLEAPWYFLVMVADGHLGIGVVAPACVLVGSLLGLPAVTRAGRRAPPAGGESGLDARPISPTLPADDSVQRVAGRYPEEAHDQEPQGARTEARDLPAALRDRR